MLSDNKWPCILLKSIGVNCTVIVEVLLSWTFTVACVARALFPIERRPLFSECQSSTGTLYTLSAACTVLTKGILLDVTINVNVAITIVNSFKTRFIIKTHFLLYYLIFNKREWLKNRDFGEIDFVESPPHSLLDI